MTNAPKKSRYSFIVALLLCMFLGCFGIHRFYTGRMISGLFMLVTFGFFGIWTFIDFLLIATGLFMDGDGLRVKP